MARLRLIISVGHAACSSPRSTMVSRTSALIHEKLTGDFHQEVKDDTWRALSKDKEHVIKWDSPEAISGFQTAVQTPCNNRKSIDAPQGQGGTVPTEARSGSDGPALIEIKCHSMPLGLEIAS